MSSKIQKLWSSIVSFYVCRKNLKIVVLCENEYQVLKKK